jgi:hypothetical protein
MEREPHRKFLGRLRNPLSLLLQLVIFLLLLLALARPEEAGFLGRRSSIIVLDMRARMQASGVFDDALGAVQDVISRLGPNDEVAILAVEGVPRIISSFSNDGKELRRKLASLEPSDAGGNLEETLLLARRLLEAKPGERKLIVIGDRETSIPENVDRSPSTARGQRGYPGARGCFPQARSLPNSCKADKLSQGSVTRAGTFARRSLRFSDSSSLPANSGISRQSFPRKCSSQAMGSSSHGSPPRTR